MSTTFEQMKRIVLQILQNSRRLEPCNYSYIRDEGHNILIQANVSTITPTLYLIMQDKDRENPKGKFKALSGNANNSFWKLGRMVSRPKAPECTRLPKKKRLEELEKLKKQKQAFLAMVNSLDKQKYLLVGAANLDRFRSKQAGG